MRVLLGGGIGSGKSAVAALLADRGAVVIDSDRLGHRVLEPGAEAFAAVSKRWPEVVVDGRIDRARLASIVFADPDALSELEAISHPAIMRRIGSEAEAAGDAPVVVEIPVLLPIEGGSWRRVLVDAPEGVRLDRAVRRGADREDTRHRMLAQAGRDEWLAWADHVIGNDRSLHDLEQAVEVLWATIHPTTT